MDKSTFSPINGTYIDSNGQLRNLDGQAVSASQAGYSPFNGDFIDSTGQIRNIDGLGGGGGGNYPPVGGVPFQDLSENVKDILELAETAIQTETDPTVPSWAKAPSKPTYTASEVGAATPSDVQNMGQTAKAYTDSSVETAKAYTDSSVQLAKDYTNEVIQTRPTFDDLEESKVGLEKISNKVSINENSTYDQYPNAKSVYDLIQTISATVPAGGLKVPTEIGLESLLPLPETLEVGDYFFIQEMDVTSPGKTGRAWVNRENPSNPTSPLKLYKVFDQFFYPDESTISFNSENHLEVKNGGITFEKLDSGVNFKLSGATGTYPINSSYFAGKTIGSTFYLLPAVLPIPTNLEISKYVYKVVVYDNMGNIGVITSYDAYSGFIVTVIAVNLFPDNSSINTNTSGKLQIADSGITNGKISEDTVKYLGRYSGAYEIANSYFSGKSINSTFVLPFNAVSSYNIDSLGANNSINKILFYDGTGYIGAITSWEPSGYVVKIISAPCSKGGRYLGEFSYSPTGDTRPTNATEKDWIRLASSGGGISTYLYQQWNGTQWVDMLNDVFCSIFDLAVSDDKLYLLGFTGKKSTGSPSTLASIDLSELSSGGDIIPIWSNTESTTGRTWNGAAEKIRSFSGTIDSVTTNTVKSITLLSAVSSKLIGFTGFITVGAYKYPIGQGIYSGTAVIFSSWVHWNTGNVFLNVLSNSGLNNIPYEVTLYYV